jgi:hypothetical protein
MPVTREQHNAVFKIARTHPGCRIDTTYSTSAAILVVDPKKNRRWVINNKGKIRRVVDVTA